MNSKEISEMYFGKCVRDTNWCFTHSHAWMLNDEVCPVMDDCIELAEAAVVDYRVSLRDKVNAIPNAGDYDQMGRGFRVPLDDVLMLIENGWEK